MNSHLESFRNLHSKDTAIVFGSGPTIKEYDSKFNKDSILIGVNEIVDYPTLMDYYFIGDACNKDRGYLSDPIKYNNYKPKIAKFIRIPDPEGALQPKPIPRGLPHSIYYNVKQKVSRPRFENDFPKFTDALSITFEALQFALFTGFHTIYLVGQDCDYSNGTFTQKPLRQGEIIHQNVILDSWHDFKLFVDAYYPKVKIVTINPVKMNLFENLH